MRLVVFSYLARQPYRQAFRLIVGTPVIDKVAVAFESQRLSSLNLYY